jgi:predicted GTPase
MIKYQNKKNVIISIMGAQSTGKSYLMNRLFGSRFSVASTRCTDGIWLSFHTTKYINFILLDCEGLFSIDRT